MTQMHNPAHPGEVLREYMGEMEVAALARHLKVSRVTLSRILNGVSGISADMSLRLSDALGTSPDFWYSMQAGWDMWQAKKKKRPRIARVQVAA